MSSRFRSLSRRSFLLETAPALAGGAVVLGSARPGLAQKAEPTTAPTSAEKTKIWSNEYWAQKGDVKLYMNRKRVSAPKSGAAALPVLFLTHGSSISSKSFDLNVPGHGEYSLMDKFAGYGYDVWTMDFEGYGHSSRTDGNSDIKSGVEDLKAAVEVLTRETGQQKFHLFGESSGALRAGAFAMAQPERINRMVLAALTYTGEGSPTLADRAKQIDYYRTHTRRPRDRDMIRSIFTRDKPGTSDPAAGEALADAELPFGDTVPTGTYLDMVTNLPLVDPTKIHAPVLVVRGEYDGIATEVDLISFFRQLPNADRQFAVLPGTAHSVALAKNRHLFWHVMRAFLDMPAPVSIEKAG